MDRRIYFVLKNSTFCFGIILTFLLSGCTSFSKETTDTIYLIPEEYEGDLIVVYNVPGAELLPKEEEFSVVTFAADGTAVTSTKNMKFGTVNDLYYTVNKEGQRTKIDSSCIHFSSTGSRTENSWEFPFANLEVTRTACSQEFSANGREVPENQEHPAEKKMRDLMQRIQERYMNKVK
ncbi:MULTISPECIES: lipoprotein [Bacillus]|uniref:Lipoprotein n=5 Tax=Bacillus cereus group TaxID=86661 RepID=A0AAE4BJX3_BACAN|nr:MULTISPECIES: lipoprotein [Bacillus]AAP26261.1 putative lipoprotein [Bacillus anthracis str. Ames]AAT31516.1 putative lipoprotein [Bacillus anthracis str. 'Ames Ancestor']AAT54546.1 lipoprotein, putative [Bacillus anthracis str. Sterne]AJG29107.1 hypothetical protein TM00_11895 [Bacillus anthracis]AJH27308.1 hypothetical protein BF31_4375 [Bacillus anthracis]